MDILNPATGQKYATLAAGDEADVNLAYNAAHHAAEGWALTPLAERQAILQKIANIIEDIADELVARNDGHRQTHFTRTSSRYSTCGIQFFILRCSSITACF